MLIRVPMLVSSLLLLGATGIGQSQGAGHGAVPQDAPLEITYIANEGFLVSVGGDKVLIDALHENPWGYANTPLEVREMMAADEPPFDDLDLVVVSHPHTDHFSPGLVHSYLARHPGVTFVGSQATIGLMRDSVGTAFNQVEGQLREVSPPWGESQTLSLGERTILHMADLFPGTSVEYLEGYGLQNEKIDVLFADPWFVTSADGQRLIREVIRPEHLILMHLRPQDWSEQEEEVMALWPEAVVLQAPMEGRVF